KEASDRPAPTPAPDDDRPAVSLAARRRLAELMVAGRPELVTEWVRLLGRAGRRPPEALLPALLTSAAGNQQLREALARVLGLLAAWLAGRRRRIGSVASCLSRRARPIQRPGEHWSRRPGPATEPGTGPPSSPD